MGFFYRTFPIYFFPRRLTQKWWILAAGFACLKFPIEISLLWYWHKQETEVPSRNWDCNYRHVTKQIDRTPAECLPILSITESITHHWIYSQNFSRKPPMSNWTRLLLKTTFAFRYDETSHLLHNFTKFILIP